MTFMQIEEKADELLRQVERDLTNYPNGLWDSSGNILESADGLHDAAMDIAVKLKNDGELAVMRAKAYAERAARDAVTATIRSLENQVIAATAGVMDPIIDKAVTIERSAYDLQRKVQTALDIIPGMPNVPGINSLTRNVSMLRASTQQLAALRVPNMLSEIQVPTVADLTGMLTGIGKTAYDTATTTFKRGLDTVKYSVDTLKNVFTSPDISKLVSLDTISNLFNNAGVSVTKFISGLENSPLSLLEFGSIPGVLELTSSAKQLGSAVSKIYNAMAGVPSDLEEFVTSTVAMLGNFTSVKGVLSGAASDDIDLSTIASAAPGLAADAFLPTKKFIPSQHLAASEGFDHVAGVDRLSKTYDFDRSHYYTEGANRYAKAEERMKYQQAVLLKINGHRSQE